MWVNTARIQIILIISFLLDVVRLQAFCMPDLVYSFYFCAQLRSSLTQFKLTTASEGNHAVLTFKSIKLICLDFVYDLTQKSGDLVKFMFLQFK